MVKKLSPFQRDADDHGPNQEGKGCDLIPLPSWKPTTTETFMLETFVPVVTHLGKALPRR